MYLFIYVCIVCLPATYENDHIWMNQVLETIEVEEGSFWKLTLELFNLILALAKCSHRLCELTPVKPTVTPLDGKSITPQQKEKERKVNPKGEKMITTQNKKNGVACLGSF